jgi:hypothetical protein
MCNVRGKAKVRTETTGEIVVSNRYVEMDNWECA